VSAVARSSASGMVSWEHLTVVVLMKRPTEEESGAEL
jgi:hypothetical protein